jgi:chromosome segregation ATPase
MTGTLIDLISDMKTCLALALGTGLILGYLYTKFRARELFKPDIKNLKQKIEYNGKESNDLLTKNSELENELELYNNKLNKSNLKITKHKKEISDLESNLRELELEGGNIKSQYQKQENILNKYNNEIKELKGTLEIESISDIENKKVAIKAKTIEVSNIYQQKSDMFEGMNSEEKELKRENSELSSKVSSFEALLNKKGMELSNANDKVSTIREELQHKFNQLIETKDENEAKIEYFKKQLLAIKNKLS